MNLRFENDVKMYGTETIYATELSNIWFENDVKMYGTETEPDASVQGVRLRMM